MSYLPRMSKTYKEPQQQEIKEPEEISSLNTLKIASSLLNDKVYNPQTILKHYRYHPHPLPVLPGPSVLEEVMENELLREASRLRRSATKMETIAKASEIVAEDTIPEENEEANLDNESVADESLKRPQSRKGIKKSKSNLGKKRSVKHLKRESSSKITLNVCPIKTETPFGVDNVDSNSKNETGSLESLKINENPFNFELTAPSISSIARPPKVRNIMEDWLKRHPIEEERRNVADNSTQCALVGSFTKAFIVPPVINSLLRVLLFLLHEINKEIVNKCPKDKKTVLSQSLTLLEGLCNEKVDKDYSFDMTYSDFKRLEKILGELKKYLKDVYGDKSDYIDKMEDLKRIFIELRKKEMELFDLGEKISEVGEEPKEIVVSDKDMKNPEVALQNSRLESEQLAAEVEFSLIELRNYQKTLAELDWDIRNSQKQMFSLKKSSSSSRTEVSGKKEGSRKFSNEVLMKGGKNVESESGSKKKT